MTDIGWKFDNSYTQLSQNIMSRTLPTKVKSPNIVIVNYELAKQLGLDFSSLNNEELAQLFTGNEIPKQILSACTLFVIPILNPDGAERYTRINANGVDLNRDWAQFNHPETRAVRDFMAQRVKETNGKFYFGIDFHSTWDDIYYTLDKQFIGNMPGLVPDWLTAIKSEMKGYDPNIRPSDKIEPTAVSRNFFFVAHGAEALVFEIGDETDRGFIKEKGRFSN